MHKTDALFQELAQGITAPDPTIRARAADEVTDVHRAFNAEQIGELAQRLVAARLVEGEAKCQEAQLNALCELKAWHEIERNILAPLSSLQLAPGQEPQSEYREELLGTPAA
jgi:hypothetical protein